MKRSGPPQRRTPLKRRKQLDGFIEAGNEWHDYNRARAAGLQRSKPLKSKPKRKSYKETRLRRVFRQRVFEMAEGTCTVTDEELDYARDDPHHVVPKRVLKRDGHPLEVQYDPENGIAVKRDRHMAHEYAPGQRIPRSKVPQRCLDWAERMGYWHVIERLYPET